MRRFPLELVSRFPFRMAILLACIVGSAVPSQAQTGIYAEFSTSDLQAPNVDRQYGPTFGFYHEIFHPPFFRVGFDARATLLGSGSTKADMGFIGPQIQIHPHVLPLMPYVEGLVGVGYVHLGQGSAITDETKLDYEGVIGVDWTILPRIDWRVVEFSAGGFSGLGGSVSPRTLSTGVVLRLP
jgi:hypothetical protein